jgi:hypothetical protein
MFQAFKFLKLLNLENLLFRGVSSYLFADYFKDYEKVEVIREIFGKKTEEVLSNLRVDFTLFGGYMGVNPFNGHLMINPRYLNNGSKLDIHLDLIHELVHIRQFMEGMELFDRKYSYVERPTEIEAYRYAVKEAKKLGQSDERICEYLKTEWINNEDLKRLTRVLEVKC